MCPVAEVRIPFEVEVNYAGWRLDRYLQEKLGRASRSRVQQLIRERLVHEEPRALKASTRVWPGLRFWLLKEEVPEPEGLPEHLGILFDDGAVLAVDKPAGLPVHPTARYFEHTLTSILGREHRDAEGLRPDPAHRLDRETSGVLLCGRRPEVTRRLKALFADHGEVEKRYLALCEGWPEEERFTVDAPLALIGEHAVRIRMSVVPPGHPGGAEARTRFTLRERYRDDAGRPLALLECALETGRQHQIRAHLHHRGLPLVGDKIYGADEQRFLRFLDDALSEEDLAALRLPRHALHAASIALPHPVSGERLEVEAPLPGDLAALISGLRAEPRP
ncbi:MAG: RluA family pseudouridine synthase [Deltaproteobacteria bacterium]|nr:RluA family pseudouridine synthase [Deltaproteobacteria bacterium]